MRNLENLTIFYVPRLCSQSRKRTADVVWPPKLREVYIQGQSQAVDCEALLQLPPSLRCLSFQDCRRLSVFDVKAILAATSTNLRGLVLGPGLVEMVEPPYQMDDLLDLIPHVTHLTLYVDYISLAFFENARRWRSADGKSHPLKHLVAGSESIERYYDVMDDGEASSTSGYVYDAMMEGGLSNLRIVTDGGRLTFEENGGIWESTRLSNFLEKLDDEKGGFEDAFWDPEVKEGPWNEPRWHMRDL